jgi:hypothetical protein
MEYYNKKTRESYEAYLKNKRVVLVGPAPSIIDSKLGKNIDSFDVVVRLNKALPLKNHLIADIGSRTDILYNCMNPSEECGGKINYDVLQKAGIKYLIGAYPPLEQMDNTKLRLRKDLHDFYRNSRGKLHDIKFGYFDHINYFTKLWNKMKLPNTGIMAILDLLQYDIKELHITGITFFKGGYYHEYRPYNEKQVLNKMKHINLLKYMTERLITSQRCTFDEPLQKILDEELARINSSDVKGDSDNSEKDKEIDSVQSKDKDNKEIKEIKEIKDEYTTEQINAFMSTSVRLWTHEILTSA